MVVGAVLGLGSGAGSADPAKKNPIGNFFGKVGEAIANNPLNTRKKRKPRRTVQHNEPAFDIETRKQIQTRLNELGLDAGPADGIFGRGTRGSISEYQKSLDERSTGYLTAEQADQLLGNAGPYQTQSAQGGAAEPAKPSEGAAKEIASADAVWTSLAMRSCEAKEMLACMDRFGAPDAAVAFVRQSGEAGAKAGLLADFEDFGIVDLGQVQYPQNGRETVPVLLNGGPPLITIEKDLLQSLRLTDDVYRNLVGRYGELKLFDQPRLESHRLKTRGGQRFVFAYRLAKCQDCAAPGEAFVAFDFDAAGAYEGPILLGISGRNPNQDWLAGKNASPETLSRDTGALQRRLAQLGFDAGPLDGQSGKQTETALIQFQADHGLRRSGEADERTLQLLAKDTILVEINRFEQIYRLAKEPEIIEFVLQNGISVLNRARKQLDSDGETVARMYGRIARLYDRQKDYARALPYAQKAIRLSAAAGLEKSQSHAFYLFNLGETYRRLGRDDEALQSFTAAFDVFEPLASSQSDRSARKLAAKAFEGTGERLIALYDKRGQNRAAQQIRTRLEKMEAELAAAK